MDEEKEVTVKELIEELKEIEAAGYGDYPIVVEEYDVLKGWEVDEKVIVLNASFG